MCLSWLDKANLNEKTFVNDEREELEWNHVLIKNTIDRRKISL